MTTITDLLLKLDPTDAIVRIINHENGTNFETDQIEVVSIESIGGARTRIQVKIKRKRSILDDLPAPGEITLDYNRLDVGEYFGTVVAGWRPAMPSTTQELLDEISRRTGQRFRLDDMVLETISRHNGLAYRLRAKAESLRWYGSLTTQLMNLTRLETYMAENLMVSSLSLSPIPQLRSPGIAFPYVNITPFWREVMTIPVGLSTLQAPALATFLQKVLPIYPDVVLQPGPRWVHSSTPQPNNLYGAKLSVRAEAVTPPAGRAFTHRHAVTLDPAYCTNFDGGEVSLWYVDTGFKGTEIIDQPRLTQLGTNPISDASAWGNYLHTLVAGSVWREFSGSGPFKPSGPEEWIFHPTRPSRTNLYNAVIQYNGLLRSIDVPPAHKNLKRVLVLTLSDLNTGYSGNISFHYNRPGD